MAASTSDKFRKASSGTRPVPTSLASPKPSGTNTATISSATGWNTTTGVDVIIYRTDTSGNVVAGTQTDWVAVLSGTSLSGMVLKAGTEPATGYPAGSQSVVVCTPTAAWADSLIDGLLSAGLTQAGGMGAITPTSITTPTLVVTSGSTLPAGDIGTADIADSAVTPAKLAAGSGTSWAYQSYIPTWTGLTVGNGTVTARYQQIGKTVHFKVMLLWGNTTAVTGSVQMSLPVTAPAILGTGNVIGTSKLYDGTNGFIGPFTQTSTTQGVIRWFQQQGTGIKESNISATVPNTWSTGHEFHIWGSYEAA